MYRHIIKTCVLWKLVREGWQLNENREMPDHYSMDAVMRILYIWNRRKGRWMIYYKTSPSFRFWVEKLAWQLPTPFQDFSNPQDSGFFSVISLPLWSWINLWNRGKGRYERFLLISVSLFLLSIPFLKFALKLKPFIRPRRQTTTNISFVAQPSLMHAVIWQQRR
jgi:hypothetical protein